jgi:hypothetical protein
MNKEMFDRGLEIRKKVLGAEFVEKSLATADAFNMPMQELTTEYCWGAVWGREGLPHKTRSMLNLAKCSCRWRSTPAFPPASIRSELRAKRSPKLRRAPDATSSGAEMGL